MTDDRSEFTAAREAGLRQRHEQRLAQATYTAVEVEALVKTASNLGRELGRREAAEEIALAIVAQCIDAEWPNDDVSRNGALAASIAREIATKEPK